MDSLVIDAVREIVQVVLGSVQSNICDLIHCEWRKAGHEMVGRIGRGWVSGGGTSCRHNK